MGTCRSRRAAAARVAGCCCGHDLGARGGRPPLRRCRTAQGYPARRPSWVRSPPIPGCLQLVRRSQPFARHEEELLRRLTEIAELALLSRLSNVRVSQYADRIRSVAEVSASLHQSLRPADAMSQAAEMLRRALGVGTVRIGMVDEVWQELSFPVYRRGERGPRRRPPPARAGPARGSLAHRAHLLLPAERGGGERPRRASTWIPARAASRRFRCGPGARSPASSPSRTRPTTTPSRRRTSGFSRSWPSSWASRWRTWRAWRRSGGSASPPSGCGRWPGPPPIRRPGRSRCSSWRPMRPSRASAGLAALVSVAGGRRHPGGGRPRGQMPRRLAEPLPVAGTVVGLDAGGAGRRLHLGQPRRGPPARAPRCGSGRAPWRWRRCPSGARTG